MARVRLVGADVGEAQQDELAVDHAPAVWAVHPYVAQEPVVPVGVADVALEQDLLPLHQLTVGLGGFAAPGLVRLAGFVADLRGVDADVPDAFDAAVRRSTRMVSPSVMATTRTRSPACGGGGSSTADEATGTSSTSSRATTSRAVLLM